jgi:phenylacetic acid degradation operon negative regulatory protein
MGRSAITARDILLTLLGAEGEITIPEKAPNMAMLFAPLLKGQHTKPQLTRAVYRLRKIKLITVRRQDHHTRINLTAEGRTLALKYALDAIELDRPYRWDGTWQMVMFDIPNAKRVARNAFRTRIKRLGLVPLQESVWVTPFPCREEIRFIAQMLNLKEHIKTMTVSSLDEQDVARLKQMFGLH